MRVRRAYVFAPTPMPYGRCRVPMAPEGDGNAPAGDPKPEGDPKPDPGAEKLAQIEAENKALADKLKAKEADDKRKAEDAKKKKAIEEGKTKEVLTETESKLKAMQEENERLHKAFLDRAEGQLKGLPDTDQERIAKYKDKVPTDVYLSMIDDAVDASRSAAPAEGDDVKKSAPAAGGTIANPGKGKSGEYEPTDRGIRFLSDAMRPDAIEHLKKLKLMTDDETGARKFTKPIQNFVGDMNRIHAHSLTAENAAKRDRGNR